MVITPAEYPTGHADLRRRGDYRLRTTRRVSFGRRRGSNPPAGHRTLAAPVDAINIVGVFAGAGCRSNVANES